MADQDDVIAYYGGDVEADRLDTGAGVIEFERTKEILLRHLPPRATIADVGGAVGRYAEWLVEHGHSVEVVDPVPSHVEAARERAGDPPRFGVHLGDARALPFADESFDAVLLFGPLYHLGEPEDRARAISEASRVSRPDALVFAAAISRLAPLLESVRRSRFDEGLANALEETATGRRVTAERRNAPFPDAYFHLPRELEEELAAAGLEVEGLHGVEGPGWLLVQPDEPVENGNLKEAILAAAKVCETDREMAAVSAHLLAVARKHKANALGAKVDLTNIGRVLEDLEGPAHR